MALSRFGLRLGLCCRLSLCRSRTVGDQDVYDLNVIHAASPVGFSMRIRRAANRVATTFLKFVLIVVPRELGVVGVTRNTTEGGVAQD